MSQTALIIKDLDREKIYSLNLQMYLNTDVIPKNSIEDFLKLIEVLPKIDLVIINEIDFSQKETNIIIGEVTKKNPYTPVLVITTRTSTTLEETLIEPPKNDLKNLLKSAAQKLGVTAQDMANLKMPDYLPFPLSFFEIINYTPCSIFLQKNKEYIPFKSAKESVTENELKTLLASKLSTFFILSKDRLKFTNFFTDNMAKKLASEKPSEQKLAETAVAVDVTQQYIREMGLDETALKMTKSCIDTMFKMIKTSGQKASTLDKMLSQLLNQQSSYNFTHSQLTATLACHAIGQMSWGSTEQQEKIVFISFFHNVLLKKDEYCKIDSDEQVKNLSIPQQEKDEILKHAQNTAQLLSQYPKVPLGSDEIVKQHHGSRNGIGFPAQASASISPLAMVFYVCELLAHGLLDRPFNMKKTFEKIHEKAPKGTKTKSLIEALEKLDFQKFT